MNLSLGFPERRRSRPSSLSFRRRTATPIPRCAPSTISPPPTASSADMPAGRRSAAGDGAREARHHPPLLAPGGGLRADRRRAARRDRDPDGQRQNALLQPAGLNLLLRDPDARAMYLFPTKALAEDQLHEFHGAVEEMGADIRAFTLRRRYAAGRPQSHPPARQRGPHQSRHAALRHPAASHALGAVFREPAVHRHRRAALLSRRLRQPSGESAAAAAAHLRVLRLEAAVHLLLGHHRQSARTGGGADRRRRSSWSSATARRAARSSSSSTIRRW